MSIRGPGAPAAGPATSPGADPGETGVAAARGQGGRRHADVREAQRQRPGARDQPGVSPRPPSWSWRRRARGLARVRPAAPWSAGSSGPLQRAARRGSSTPATRVAAARAASSGTIRLPRKTRRSAARRRRCAACPRSARAGGPRPRRRPRGRGRALGRAPRAAASGGAQRGGGARGARSTRRRAGNASADRGAPPGERPTRRVGDLGDGGVERLAGRGPEQPPARGPGARDGPEAGRARRLEGIDDVRLELGRDRPSSARRGSSPGRSRRGAPARTRAASSWNPALSLTRSSLSRRGPSSSEIASRTGKVCTGAPGGGVGVAGKEHVGALQVRRQIVGSRTLRPGLLP